MEVIVNAKTVGKMLGISERHVRRLVNEGILTRIKNGQYDLVECGQRYIKHITEREKMRSSKKDELETEKLAEQVLHERAKRQKAEIIVAELEGTMHSAADIERLWSWTVTAFKSRIRALPLKVAPLIQHTTDLGEINTILQREIDEALKELSDYDPEKFHKNGEEIDEDTEA